MPFSVKKERERLMFSLQRTAEYHRARTAFFSNLHTLLMAFILLGGATAVYTSQLGRLAAVATPVLGLLIVCLSIMDLLLKTGERAHQFQDLSRRFTELQEEVVGTASPTAQDISRWQGRRMTIEKDEPPTLYVLNCLVHNKVVYSRYTGEEATKYLIGVTSIQRLFAPFFDFCPGKVRHSTGEKHRESGPRNPDEEG
jgi:hypothetical protein